MSFLKGKYDSGHLIPVEVISYKKQLCGHT